MREIADPSRSGAPAIKCTEITATDISMKGEIMPNFDEVEALFTALMGESASNLSIEELEEIREFVGVGEYGLALETIVAIYAEEGKAPGDPAMKLIGSLAKAMSMNLVLPSSFSSSRRKPESPE